MRPLSHSSISMYLECPQRYKFKYIEKMPELPKYYFSFGQSVHKALEYFYGGLALHPPSVDDVLDYLQKHWKKEGYKNALQEAEYLAEGKRILSEYHKKHAPDYHPPFFAEYSFNLKVDGVPVTGKVDRIDKTKNEKLAVVDYKTGKAFDIEKVQGNPQLTMYQMACEELLELPVESLTFYHLPSLTPFTVDPHTESQVKDLRRRIVKVSESIQAGQFAPTPQEAKCSFCDYKPHCPVFRHLYVTQEGPAPAAAGKSEAVLAPEKSEDEILADLVDRYGKLRSQVHELQASADDVKEEIVELLRKKGYVRAFGTAYEVSVAREEKWEFPNRAQVLEVLKAHGLYERILAPSSPAVQKLMKDSKLPPSVRTELEKLGKKVETAVLRCKMVEEE